MDIRLRDNKFLIGLVATVVAACILAGGLLLLSGPVYGTSADSVESPLDDVDFGEDLYRYSLALYWRMYQSWNEDRDITPFDAFMPNLASELRGSGLEYYRSDDVVYYDEDPLTEILDRVWDSLDGWGEDLDYLWGHYAYLAYYSPEQESLGSGNISPELTELAQGWEAEEALQESYQYYVSFTFDRSNQLKIRTIYGGSEDAFATVDADSVLRDMIFDDQLFIEALRHDSLSPPQLMTFVFAIPQNTVSYGTWLDYSLQNMELWAFQQSFTGWFLLFMALAAIVGLVLAARTGVLLSLSLEPAVFLAFVPLMLYSTTSRFMITLRSGQSIAPNMTRILSDGGVMAFGYVMVFLLLGGGLWLLITAVMSLWQVRELGPGLYLRERTWTLRFFRFLGRNIGRLYGWVTDIDLTGSSDRRLLRIVGVNFIAVSLCCTIWLLGIFAALVYSVVLFLLLRRYLRDIRRQYDILLRTTGEMAKGDLDVEMAEDLGLFSPLLGELKQVQRGFQEAVEAETRSQAMRTELITNVSHDLKTPLTALTTYIGLLKQEDTTEEQRREYLETLDKKAARLGRLIDDLFEMSKASSKNLVLYPAPVDLSALIRQVELENREDLEEADIVIRYRLPEEPVVTTLDGERTSRIFDNLIRNVALYGLPGSRGYITLERIEDVIRVEIKNVSTAPLDFDTDLITERFVRGDSSRSTEGSDLGLAIAKSLTELQGGTFRIEVDDDLFKAILTFPYLPPETAGVVELPAAEVAPESLQ